MQRKKIQLAELSDCLTKMCENPSSAEIIEVWKYDYLNIGRGLAYTSLGT